MYKYTAIFLFAHAVFANRLLGSEDDFMSPDMTLPSEGVGQFVQPDVTNLNSDSVGARERDDIDADDLQPMHKKKPRRTNLQRIKNHRSRHGGNSKANAVKVVNIRSIQWKLDSLTKGKLCFGCLLSSAKNIYIYSQSHTNLSVANALNDNKLRFAEFGTQILQ